MCDCCEDVRETLYRFINIAWLYNMDNGGVPQRGEVGEGGVGCVRVELFASCFVFWFLVCFVFLLLLFLLSCKEQLSYGFHCRASHTDK